MADFLTPEERSARMARIRAKDTTPEMIVRKTTHALGYRFRLHRPDLPGKPDLVFPRHRKIIFVHGCFWHQHPSGDCADAKTPQSNQDYWVPKLARNVERDAMHIASLKSAGWRILVIWACQTRHRRDLAGRLRSFLGPDGHSTHS